MLRDHTSEIGTKNSTTKLPKHQRPASGIPGTRSRWPEQGHVKIPSKTRGSRVEIAALAACAKWVPKQVISLLHDMQTEIFRTQEIVRGSQNIGLHSLDVTMELARLSLARDRYESLLESIGASNLRPFIDRIHPLSNCPDEKDGGTSQVHTEPRDDPEIEHQNALCGGCSDSTGTRSTDPWLKEPCEGSSCTILAWANRTQHAPENSGFHARVSESHRYNQGPGSLWPIFASTSRLPL